MITLKDKYTKEARVFLIRKRFNGGSLCKRIQVEENKRRLLLFKFPNKDLEDRGLTSHFNWVVEKLYEIDHSSISKPVGICEDSLNTYVIVEDEIMATLSELIQKRETISEFEMKYFLTQFYFSLSHLRSKGFILTKLTMDDFNIDLSVKINFGFPFWLTEVGKLKQTLQLMKFNHIGRHVNCVSDQQDRIILWEIGLLMYHLLEGRPLISNQFQRGNVLEGRFQVVNLKLNSDAYNLLHKLLFSHDFKLSDLPYDPFLKKPIPKILPQSIVHCPPSKRFQQDILKHTIPDQSQIDDKRTTKSITTQQKKQQSNKHLALDVIDDDEMIYVDEFCDITCKFGYGYKMSNGLIGFYYNDRTLLILVQQSNNREIHYFDENWNERIYREDKLLDEHDLKKKLYILDSFRKAICQFKKPILAPKKIVYIKNYVKVKNAKIFLLSNDTSQSKFIDNTQILCQSAQTAFYLGKKTQEFVPISRQDSNEIQVRQTYTRELAMKLFNWLKPSDDIKYSRQQQI